MPVSIWYWAACLLTFCTHESLCSHAAPFVQRELLVVDMHPDVVWPPHSAIGFHNQRHISPFGPGSFKLWWEKKDMYLDCAHNTPKQLNGTTHNIFCW